MATSKETGVKYGLLEHCGTKENQYPIVLSNDKELQDWIAKLQGKGVYIGVQAEWIDWVGCFSKATVFASSNSNVISPTGVSKRCRPGVIRPRCASATPNPIVP